MTKVIEDGQREMKIFEHLPEKLLIKRKSLDSIGRKGQKKVSPLELEINIFVARMRDRIKHLEADEWRGEIDDFWLQYMIDESLKD